MEILKQAVSDTRHIGLLGELLGEHGLNRIGIEDAPILYSEMIDCKTNVIPVAQKILSSLELKNSIVSFDAMNTQQRTREIIIEQKGEYVEFALQSITERQPTSGCTPGLLRKL